MAQGQIFIKLLKLLSFLLCMALFWLLMADIFDKFVSRLTNIGITVTGSDTREKLLPCFTVCPGNVFKTPGFYFKEKDFIENSFSADELFCDDKYISVFNKTIYVIEELKTLFSGRCFMVCVPAAQVQKEPLIVAMRKMTDIKGLNHLICFPRHPRILNI